jgi:hypothetical protein
MSTTSCPRCNAQVTLPVGAPSNAIVRCPLCRAQYALAEALVTMPPLLEIVETEEPAGDEWLEPERATSGSPIEAAAGEEIEFAAEEADDDELIRRQPDTEVEDLTLSTFDSVPGQTGGEPPPTQEWQPAAAGGDDELDLDFGAKGAAGAETLQFGAAERDQDADELAFDEDASTMGEEPATLDFGSAPTADVEDEVKFELDSREESKTTMPEIQFEEDEVPFDREARQAASPGETELKEFGDVQFEASGEAEEIPLDLGAEPAAPVAAEGEEPEDTKKGKRKKEKAAKAANGRPKSSALVRYAVPAVIAVPLVLYFSLWAGYDLVGLSGALPKVMLPEKFAKKRQFAQAPGPSGPAAQSPADLITAGKPIAPDPGAETPAPGSEPSEPTDQPTPADEAPALKPDEPAAPPAGEPAALTEGAPAEAAPKDEAAKPAEEPAAPAEGAPTPKEGAAATSENDPFAPAKPEEPKSEPSESPPIPETAEEMPKKEGDAAADPFAPAPSGEKPAEPPAVEKPAAADDPFSTPAAGKPADKPAAEDPFAPAPESKPDEKPADEAKSEPLPDSSAPAQPAEVMGPRNAHAVSAAEVGGALQATMAAAQQMSAAEGAGDEAALRKARANFYVSLFNMADAITLGQLGPDRAQLDPQLRAMEQLFRQQLSADPKRFESLKVFGARWFAFPKRTTQGVAVGGTVDSVGQVGKLFHTKIKPGPASGAESVTVVSAKDPGLAAGDEALTLGSIVEKPQAELAGYEGSETAVIWSGMTLKIAPAAQ